MIITAKVSFSLVFCKSWPLLLKLRHSDDFIVASALCCVTMLTLLVPE